MTLTPILTLIAAILIVGVLVWGIRSMPAIDPMFKQVAVVLLVVVLAVYAIIVLFGLFGVSVPHTVR